MTILSAVNSFQGKTVRIQTIKNGFTEFVATDSETNHLLLGRTAGREVNEIKTYEENGKIIYHIYGINYSLYNF